MVMKILSGIIVVLFVTVIGLMIKLSTMEKKLFQAQLSEAASLTRALKATESLNNQAVQMVDVPSIVYQDRIVKEKPKIEYITKEVEKLVMLPSYSNTCFDASGVQLANSIINRTYDNPTTTSQPSQ